jgi:tetratricopeptide (TPR) repeat protein
LLKAWFKGKTSAPAEVRGAAPAPPPLAPDAVYARLKSAQAHMGKAEFDAARTVLEELIRSNPGEIEAQATLGMSCFLLDDFEAAIAPLRAAIAADPMHAIAHKFLASSLYKLQRLTEAVPLALRSAALNPQDVQVLTLAGSLCTMAGEWGEAAHFANLALTIKPDSVPALQQLDMISTNSTLKRSVFEETPKIAAARRRVCTQMLAAHRRKPLSPDSVAQLLGMLEGSQESFDTALDLARATKDYEPMTTVLAERLASVFWTAGDLDNTERLREFCYAEDPRSFPFRFTLANFWLMRGTQHWEESWLWLDSAQHDLRPSAYIRDVPRWTGQRIGKKKLLVYQDQGAGDAIMCFRFLGMLSARRIRYDLWVGPNLVEFAAQLQGPEKLIRTEALPTAKDHDCELAVPLFGLINALALGLDDVRNPVPIGLDPALGAAGRARVRALPGVRVGLVYGGNPERRDDWLRTPPLALARQLGTIAGVSWVNLMFDERDEKPALLEELNMMNPMPGVRGFAETAAIVSELDAVVAVDSSVAHVAASLGKPVWVLAPCFFDWRWQIGEIVSPWWPTARVLRSEGPGRFETVFPRLLSELGAFVREHPRAQAD